MHSLSGSSTQIRHLSLKALLPNTDQYMTYEGSTTHPGCWESTVWIILNKPIYITKQEVIYTIIIIIARYRTEKLLCNFYFKMLLSLSRSVVCVLWEKQKLALRFTKTYAGIRTNTQSTAGQQCQTVTTLASQNRSNKHRIFKSEYFLLLLLTPE